MANNASLDLILKILVSGEKNILTIAQNINAVKDAGQRAAASVDLSSIFTRAAKSAQESGAVFQAAFDKIEGKNALSGLRAIIAAEKQVGVDAALAAKEIEKANAALDKFKAQDAKNIERSFLAAQKEAIKLAAAVEKAAATTAKLAKQEALDTLAAKINEVRSKILALSNQKFALKVDSSNVDALAAKLAGNKSGLVLQGIQRDARGIGPAFNSATQGINTATGSLSKLTSEALFVRRAILGLGFAAAGNEVVDLAKRFDSLRATFSVVFGGNATKEFTFVREEAGRLGLNVLDLAKSYASLSQATKGTTISQEQVREVFLGVAGAAAKLQLSQDDVAGSLRAIEQIASKGKVQLEELRGQLGDRLPGAVSILAKGLGVTQEKLNQLLTVGISADTFFKTFGKGLNEAFNLSPNERIVTLASSLARLKNAAQAFVDSITSGSNSQRFAETINKIADAIANPKIQEGFRSLISLVLNLTDILVRNADVVGKLIAIYAGFRILSSATSLLSKFLSVFSAVPAASTAAAASVGAVTGQVSKLGSLLARAPLVIGIVVTGVALYQKVLDEVFSILLKVQERAQRKIQVDLEIKGQASIIAALEKQSAAVERYKNTVALSKNEVEALTEQERLSYAQALAGQTSFLSLNERVLKAKIEQTNLEIERGQGVARTTKEEIAAYDALFFKLSDLKDELKGVKGAQLDSIIATDAIKLSTQGLAASLGSLTVDNLVGEQKLLVDAFRVTTKETKGVQDAITKLFPADFANLGVAQITTLLQSFQALRNAGELTAVEFQKGLLVQLAKFNETDLTKFQVNLEVAFRAGLIGATDLSVTLRALAIDGFTRLGIDAEFAANKISKAFSDSLKVLSNLGQNAQVTGAEFKAAFDKLVVGANTTQELLALKQTLDQVAASGRSFGKDLEDSLLRLNDKILLTKDILDNALGDSFTRLGVTSKAQLTSIANQAEIDFNRIKTSGQTNLLELQTAFIKFAEETAKANNGIPPISLRLEARNLDLFDILVKSAEAASERISLSFESAVSTATTLPKLEQLRIAIENTWNSGRLSAEEYGKAVASLVIKGFDVAVEAANTAANRISKAFTNALSTAQIVPQVDALREALRTAFDGGIIGSKEFSKGLDEVKTRLFELATEAPAGFAGALGRLGVQTRDQLKAIADQAKEDFTQLRDAGVLTIGELKVAFDKYAAAAIKAGVAVTESLTGTTSLIREQGGYFQRLAEEANAYYEALQEGASKTADEWRRITESATASLGNLAELTNKQFEELIASTDRSRIGATELVEGLIRSRREALALKDIITDERGRTNDAANAEAANKQKTPAQILADLTNARQGKSSEAGAGSTNNQTNNFIFNQPNLSPGSVKDSVIPLLDRQLQRQGNIALSSSR
jgi:tape measure domain-containing protein